MALTQRETEVLVLICRQKTNRDISKILNISVRTVEEYRSNVLLKTQSQGVAGMVTFAVKHGIYIP
jgi:DNA-binding CsgD family transcriptional regulator